MKIPKQSLQQGAAAGIILVAVKLVAYLIGIDAMTSGWASFGQLVLVIAGMLMACSMERKTFVGEFSFGKAFLAAFAAAAVATFLALAMDVVLYAIIDPGLSDKMMDYTMAEFERSGMMSILPEEQLEGMVEDIQFAMKPVGQLLSWSLGLLFWGVIALIVGAVMKRKDSASF